MLFVRKFVKIQDMKGFGFLILVATVLSCQSPSNEVVSDFTGNETTYDLQSGSEHAVTGTISFKERRDGKITAFVQLSGTSGTARFPVHLHLGDLSTPDADIALLLNPVDAATGRSQTTFSMLSDETTLTYDQLTNLEASVKIHLGETGEERNVILAAGNIGASFTKAKPTGRTGIATCKSE
jgi:hypothetical protein